LKIGAMGCAETSVTGGQSVPANIPDEWSLQSCLDHVRRIKHDTFLNQVLDWRPVFGEDTEDWIKTCKMSFSL
jgi:hypothetical protein